MDDQPVDYYEVLQVNLNAEPETIHRVYRLLAQRYHPDNPDTGNESRFREIHEAYTTLSDPEKRARYDIVHEQRRHDRWRLVSTGESSQDDFEIEQRVRLTMLEALYTQRRMDPEAPALFPGDLESLTGRPREHLMFTIWYLVSRKYVQKDDQSRLQITADGVDYLEQNYRSNIQRKRLSAGEQPA